MMEDELKQRTKQFSLRIIKLVQALPNNIIGQTIGKQLIHSGTSVGANYRAVCRARSGKEFIAKLGIVIEEADESAFWLELIIENSLIKQNLVDSLLKETDEIISIMVKSSHTATTNQKNKSKNQPIKNQ